MANQQAGQGIEELYRSVIGDVINQVKEAFLDENIDIDVLHQLKRMWEDKVNQSGAVDLTPKTLPAPTIRQPVRSNVRPGMLMNQPGPSAGSSVMIQRPTATHHPIYSHQAMQQQVSHVLPQGGVHVVQGTTVSRPGQVAVQFPGNYQVIQGIPQSSIMQSHGNTMVILPGGQMVQVATAGTGSNILQAPPRPQMQAPTKSDPGGMNFINQLDGASRVPEQSDSTKPAAASKKQVEIKKKVKKIPQLDGGGPGMTDSSSEEEYEDEEDDPLRRIANRIGDDGQNPDEDENVVEEEPLNSEDDQTDDEDLNTLFEATNVVVCQFEKVHRARNKWKFALKDGIMNIRGKDYCFQKCTGEAEW